MLTIFTIPKPFTGPAAIAQDDAIASWRRVHADVEILLFGDEAGIADAAARHGVTHIGEIRRNEHGTPLLDDAFATAQGRARHRLVCYVNADIIFLPSLTRALEQIALDRFLIVGRRTDLDVPEPLDFSAADWASRLEQRARGEGRLHEPTGIDYFIFPRGQLPSIPPFPVGRALWDNWMIYHARAMKVPVVDATAELLVVHQNHDYGHVRGGQRTTEVGLEVQRNWKMLGPDFMQLTIVDATWRLGPDGAHPERAWRRLARRVAVDAALRPLLRPSVRVARFLFRAINNVAAPGSGTADKQS
jgi:hypothetical protein